MNQCEPVTDPISPQIFIGTPHKNYKLLHTKKL